VSRRRWNLPHACFAAAVCLATGALAGAPKVGAVPKALRLAPFYEKHLSAGGLPVVSSAKVPDAALVEAARLIDRMLEKRPDVRRALIRAKVRVAVMAPDEVTTDIPEHATLKPKAYWDKRARGLGATKARPATSCATENLLGLEGDRYKGESILIHEFAHTIHLMGLNQVDRMFEKELEVLFARAKKRKLWKKTYAMTDMGEYWAEAVQSYFDANLESAKPNGIHNHVNTREELAEYDPALFRLVDRVFRKTEWRFEGAHRKSAK